MKPMSFTLAGAALLLTGCAATPGGSGAGMNVAATSTAQAAPISMPDGPGRDWSRIDTNGDSLISPEEMEVWLTANPGPARGR